MPLPSDPPREGKRGTLPPRGAATRAAPPSAPSASPRARLLRVRPRARSRSAGGSSARAPSRPRAPARMRARAGALFAIVKRPPFLSPRRVVPFRSFTTTGALAFGRRRARLGVENPTVLSLELLRAVRVSADRRIRKYLVVVLGYARAHGEAAPTMIRGGRASTDRFRHASHFYFRARARRRDALLFRSKGRDPRPAMSRLSSSRALSPDAVRGVLRARARSRPRAARTRSSASSFLEGRRARRSTLPDPPPTRGVSAAPRLPPPRAAVVPPRRPPGTAPGRRRLGTLPRRTRTSTTTPRRSPRGFAR